MRISNGLFIATASATALVALSLTTTTSDAIPFGNYLEQAAQYIKEQANKLMRSPAQQPTNPHWNDAIYTNWRNGAGQSRSPCPMLNVLANHGILDYSGKNINEESVRHALQDMLGLRGIMLKVLMRAPGHLAEIHAENTRQPNNKLFDLEDSLKHNFIEHDVSLTRERRTDAEPKRALRANPDKSISAYRNVVRAREAKDGLSPPMNFSLDNKFKAHGEAMLLLEIMGRNGKIAVQDAIEFFIYERFPKSYRPLPPSSTNDVYMVSRLLQEFTLNEIMRLIGGNNPAANPVTQQEVNQFIEELRRNSNTVA
ncbi:Chloroperoxidase [Syncephalis plumigaleata]|nr:Chloroperoxidase [Syncephalis plumigaleata]